MVKRLGSVLVYGIFTFLFVTGTLLISSQIEHSEAAVALPHGLQLASWDKVAESREAPRELALAETTMPHVPLQITFSNGSGVSGYEIGIFGEGFGESGTVLILETSAAVLEWEDGFIRAVVPEVADGTGDLRVVRQNGDSVSAPFTVYSIDPLFLQSAEKTFDEISFDQPLFLDGVEFAYCNDIDNGAPIEASRFLTNYRCGSGGLIGSGEAVFASDASLGTTATLAFQSDQVLSGEYVFQFTVDTYWEPYYESQADWRKSYPRTYTLEVSADSTNGTDGTWVMLHTIADNNRTTRFHSVDIPAVGGYTWLRMHVTDGYADHSDPAGRDFLLREIHIYKVSGTGRPDAVAIYGDSLTYSAFDLIGPNGFSAEAQRRRLSDGALPLTIYGLPGAKADRLMDTTYFASDLYDAFAVDNMAENALYWGIALGTNDIGGGAANLSDPNSFLMQFDERLDGAVQELISRGRVPMIARLADTNEAAGGYGDTVSKQKVLADIDTIAATYRLIPGPDLFTLFRRNIKTNNASFISNDGTHHTYAGREALIAEWVKAFTAPFPQSQLFPTPQPSPTATSVVTNTPTATSVAPPNVPPSDNGIHIEIANGAGVIGYEIGVFGSGFGNVAGQIQMMGVNAQVITWTENFVAAVVPAVPDGEGLIHLRSDGGLNAYAPFTVYTIDPAFLQAPAVTFQNIAAGRTVYTQNAESWFCYQQPENGSAEPSEFLTDYRCGYNGITRTGSAKFSADSALGNVAIVALDLGQELSGDYFFSYFVNGNWYPRPNTGTYPESNPRDYELQVSADSTDGIDGNWLTVQTITNNDRSQRTHKLTVPAAGYHWLRMRVTDGIANETTEPGNDFGLREIRLFAPIGTSSGTPDSMVIYGDSLTASNFETIGSQGLAEYVKSLRGVDQDMPLTTFGLSGQNSSGLVDRPEVAYDMYDALALDNMQANARYWGIAIGTNDALDNAASIGIPGFNITEYRGRLDAAVAHLIALGRVPIVARIPDTDEARGGYGTLETKRKILADIDAVVAKYRLVPGPDLYTTFRRNIQTENSSYLGGDGTHHSDLGMFKMIELWGQSFVDAVPAVPPTEPLPTPIPTYTPIAQPTATLPATATPLPPTATNTPLPTATYTPTPTMTRTPVVTVTNTPTPTHTPVVTMTSTPVVTATNTPTMTSTPVVTPTHTPTSTPIVTVTNTPTPTMTSTPIPTVTSTPFPPVVGDVSCDVQRNVIDAQYISEYVVETRAGMNDCPLLDHRLNLAQCDVDEDEECDIVDAMYVAQCEAGVGNLLCGNPRTPSRQAGLPDAKLKLLVDNVGEIAVAVDMPRGKRFGALLVEITFDPELVRPVGCEINTLLIGACNLAFAANTVRLAGAAFLPEKGTIDIGHVYFMPVTSGITSAEISASAPKLTTSSGDVYAVTSETKTVQLGSVPTVIRLGAVNAAGAGQSGLLRGLMIALLLVVVGSLLIGRVGIKR